MLALSHSGFQTCSVFRNPGSPLHGHCLLNALTFHSYLCLMKEQQGKKRSKEKLICGKAVIEQIGEKMQDFLHVRHFIFPI